MWLFLAVVFVLWARAVVGILCEIGVAVASNQRERGAKISAEVETFAQGVQAGFEQARRADQMRSIRRQTELRTRPVTYLPIRVPVRTRSVYIRPAFECLHPDRIPTLDRPDPIKGKYGKYNVFATIKPTAHPAWAGKPVLVTFDGRRLVVVELIEEGYSHCIDVPLSDIDFTDSFNNIEAASA
jgi:hypothetical protein